MILVTGASGLLGSHLVYALLKKGKQVKAMVRSMHAKKNIAEVFSYYEKNADELLQKIVFVEGDVTDYFSIEQALENVTQVYHCAAYVSFNDDDFEQLQKVNYEGTANVANACLEAGVRLCHVSSVAALGEAKVGPAVSETDFWSGAANKSAYSISKYNAEREVWRAIEEGLNGFIINPSLIIGAGNWGKSSSAMLVSASKGMRFKTPGKTGFVDVRDVAQTAIALMESEVKKERFIINAGNYSFTEFYTHAAAVFNTQKPSINLPEVIAKIGLFFLRVASVFGYRSRLTKSAVRSAYTLQQFSNEKIKKQLQFEFIPFQESVVFASKLYKERN